LCSNGTRQSTWSLGTAETFRNLKKVQRINLIPFWNGDNKKTCTEDIFIEKGKDSMHSFP
jgi:hypothetical protein